MKVKPEVINYKKIIKHKILNYLNTQKLEEILNELDEYQVEYKIVPGYRAYYNRWNVVKDKIKYTYWDKEFHTIIVNLTDFLNKHPKGKEVL